MKKILRIQNAHKPHWVGDGFPVRSLFSYDGDTSALSPFLLLDYAGPVQFAPATRPRGVGELQQRPVRAKPPDRVSSGPAKFIEGESPWACS